MKHPDGLDHLFTLRLNGVLPARNVSLNIGDEWKRPDWFKRPDLMLYPEGVIRSSDSVTQLDLRSLRGLYVFCHADTYTKQVADVFNSLQKQADYILLVVREWGTDFVEWRKK